MAYIVIENFKFGLDARRSELTSKPGTLVNLENAHINQGGEVEKRKAFIKTDIVSSINPSLIPKGFQEGVDGIYVFGTFVDPGGWPSPIKYQALLRSPLSIDNTSSIGAAAGFTRVVFSTVFAGKIFVIAEFADGYFGFYDGVQITDFSSGLKLNAITQNTGLLKDLLTAIQASGVYTGDQPVLQPQTLNVYGPDGSTYTVSIVETAAAGTLTSALVNTGIPGKQATQAIGSFQIIAGTEAAGHQITQVTVGVTDLLPALAPVPFNDGVEQTASDVVVAINANTGTSGYSAVANQGTVIISSVATGTGNNGKAITVTSAVDVCIGQCIFALVGTGFSLDFINANGTNVLSAVMNYPLIPGQSMSTFVASVRDNINAGTGTHGFLSAAVGNSLYLSKAVTVSTDAIIAVSVGVTPTTGGTAVIGNLVPLLVGVSTNLLPAYFLSQAGRFGIIHRIDITPAVTALVSNGVPPYTYQWSALEQGINPFNPSVVPDTPNNATTIFRIFRNSGNAGEFWHGTLHAVCTVVDSVGATFIGPQVSIVI